MEDDDVSSILAPIQITAAMITTSNFAAEDPNPVWGANNYAVGFRVYKASTHRVYEAAQAMTAAAPKDPEIAVNRFNAAGTVTYWIDAGPTNQFAMFDGLISSKSENASSISVTLSLASFNGFALLGIEAEHLEAVVTETTSGNVLYSYSGDLEGSMPSDYYEYFFSPFKPQTQFIATGIDPYSAMTITMTLSSSAGTVRLGMFAIGDLKPLGLPLAGAAVEPLDGSYITNDAFNNTVVKKRPSTTGLSITAKCSIEDANSVVETIRQVLGTPVVVVGSQVTMYEALTVFGLPSARIVYDEWGNPSVIVTVKGLI